MGAADGCEVTAAGTVRCWGSNLSGLVTPGAPGGPVAVPTTIGSLAGVSKVVIGFGHACALAKTSLTCWGDDSSGQAGVSPTSSSVALTSLRTSVALPDACVSAHTIGAACGLMPANSCGEAADCGACSVGVCDPTSHTCGCATPCDPASEVCGAAGLCVNACGTNPATDIAGTSVDGARGFAVDSPDVYGSAGCDGYIVDDQFAMSAQTFAMPKNAPSQADCPSTFVTLKSYDSSGAFAGQNGPIAGHWSGVRNACSWGTDAYPWVAIPYKPAGTNVRYVGHAEGPYVNSKGSPTSGEIPVHIFQFAHPG
jgi:hypothetical protein